MRKTRPWEMKGYAQRHKESIVGARTWTWSACPCSIICQHTKPSALYNVLEEGTPRAGYCESLPALSVLHFWAVKREPQSPTDFWFEDAPWTFHISICGSQERPGSVSAPGNSTWAGMKRGPRILCGPGRHLSLQHTEPHHFLSWDPQD